MKTIITRLWALVGATTQVLGVAPPNDECIGASALTAGLPFVMSTTEATSTSDPVPGCQANFGRGVWFTYTPAGTGQYRVSTCGSDFDTVLAIYTGSCGALSPVACNDDNGPACGGVQASADFYATAGTTYRILAGGYAGAAGSLQIVAGLTNDRCVGALSFAPGSSASIHTADATSTGDPVPACAASFGKGVWFRLTAPADMFVRLTTCGSEFDTVLQVYTGSCDAFAPVTCSDDGGWRCIGLQASVWFPAKAGVDYYILVGGYAGASGNLVLESPPEIIDLHRNANGTVTIGYVGGTLMYAPHVGGPYTDVAGASSPYTFFPAGGRGFFRLRP